MNHLEGLTLDEDKRIDNIATGNAAGPAPVYLASHKRVSTGEYFFCYRGSFSIGQVNFTQLSKAVPR